jgi:hypothetical protein
MLMVRQSDCPQTLEVSSIQHTPPDFGMGLSLCQVGHREFRIQKEPWSIRFRPWEARAGGPLATSGLLVVANPTSPLQRRRSPPEQRKEEPI